MRAAPSAEGQSDSDIWPPLLTIARAIKYSGLSRSTLGRAIRRGDLALYGRAGGRGQRIVRREDLDRWLRGPAPVAVLSRDPLRPARTRSTSAVDPDIANALARIRAAAKGAR